MRFATHSQMAMREKGDRGKGGGFPFYFMYVACRGPLFYIYDNSFLVRSFTSEMCVVSMWPGTQFVVGGMRLRGGMWVG